MQKVLLLTVFSLSFIQLEAQDRLFSQFYASPLTLNPALTGAFEGRFRVSSIYRNQWKAVMEDPYATFSTALDMKWAMAKNTSRYHDQAAVGLLFYSDKAGPLGLSTTQISVSGAFHKALDIRNTQVISLGFQAGIAQRNVNYAKVTFEDQFNGTTGYTDPTNERFPENNFAYADYSVGLNYMFSPQYSHFQLFAGGAMHHFLTPSVSFFKNENAEGLSPENNLKPRYSAQLGAKVPVIERLQFLPRAIFDKQGSHIKLDSGANFRINTSEYKNLALHVGAYIRSVTNYDSSYKVDAVIGLVGFEFNNVLVGMSYDMNLGKVANFNRQTFEISVAYLGEYEDELILCPKF